MTFPIDDLLRLVQDTASTPNLICSHEGHIIWSNASMQHAMGVSERQLSNTSLAQWLNPGDALLNHIRGVALQSGQPVKLDVWPRQALDHALDGFQAVLSATEYERYPVLVELLNHAPALKFQAQSQHAAQQLAQRALLRNLAHEIRNPLGGIRGAAQLLAKRGVDGTSLEYTDVIIAEATRLQGLLDRLLSAQAAPHTRSHINIHETFERVRSVVSAEYPLLVWQRDYDVSLPDLWADEHQLVQVFLNLIRNAAQMLALDTESKNHASGNRPTIRLRSRSLRQVTLGNVRHKLALELLVIDNGPGIPDNVLPSLFSPLVSHRPGGTGLGLHTARSFVHQHGGQIEAHSLGGETQFRVVLPVLSP